MTEEEILLAERACARLQTQYCIHADACDVEAFTALFSEDASIKVPEYPAFVGQSAIRASMQALAATGITMRHIVTNSLIDVRSPNQASGICYLIAYGSKAAPDAHGWRPMEQPGTIGHYEDVFRRTAAGWRFTSRVLTRVLRRLDDAVLQAGRRD